MPHLDGADERVLWKAESEPSCVGREGRTALLLLLGARVSSEGNQAASEPATHAVVTADQVKFAPIEIPGFASGLKIAVVHGDPNATSGSYVIRLVFPDGYKIPPHWHPMAENATVLEGEFMLAMGDTVDAARPATRPGLTEAPLRAGTGEEVAAQTIRSVARDERQA